MLPVYLSDRVSSSHFLPLFFEDRDEVYDLLKNNGVYCGMHYKRNDKYEPFKDFKKVGGLVNAEWYDKHELTLPLHLGLTDEDTENIIKIINNR
jgi:dTDP-4-amino-4,6-dideoxygalactose transaminase